MKPEISEFVTNLIQWAEEKKAENIVSIDVSEKSQFADQIIICHGIQALHVKAIAQNIIDKSQEIKNKPYAVEGFDNAKWILIDFVDVIVHVFNEEIRNYYKLDELWKINAKNLKDMSSDNDEKSNNIQN